MNAIALVLGVMATKLAAKAKATAVPKKISALVSIFIRVFSRIPVCCRYPGPSAGCLSAGVSSDKVHSQDEPRPVIRNPVVDQ